MNIVEKILFYSVKMQNGCIEWQRYLQGNYGMVRVIINGKSKPMIASRAMWMAMNNKFDLPSRMVVRHKCDNPRCVNIDHLEIGTDLDNARDFWERNGKRKPKIRYTFVKKLTDDNVREIRKMMGTHKEISKKFGVAIDTIGKIKRGTHKAYVN